MDDPVDALLKDIRHHIVEVLYRMEKGLPRADPKELEKIKQAISNVTKIKLAKYHKDISKLKSLIKGAVADLGNIKVLRELEKLDAEIEKIHDKQSVLDKEKGKYAKQLAELSEENIKNHIKQHAKELLKVELTIVG